MSIQQGTARQVRTELTPGFISELDRLSAERHADSVDSGARLAGSLLRDALAHRASDIHIDPQGLTARVRLRIDGRLMDVAVLSGEMAGRVLRHFKAMSGLDSTDHFHPADARLTHVVDGHALDLRLACLPAVGGQKLTIRLLDRTRVLDRLDQLGLSQLQHQQIEGWLHAMHGMFLVAGPTGCGKTTTLYALLHELKMHERCVVTIEDPVEYRIEGVTQTQVDSRHDLTFSEALRAMLRADPDHLLMGEIRDGAAAHAAMEASGSGRVLMSTVHAPDAVGAVTALRNFGLDDHQIASSLRLVAAQRLVRRLCASCRRKEKITGADQEWLKSVGLPANSREFWAPVGCEQCQHLGYIGRVGIFEVWHLEEQHYEAILHHGDEHALFRDAAASGLVPLLDDAWGKVEQGVTSIEELRTMSSSYRPRTVINGKSIAKRQSRGARREVGS